MSAPKIEVHIDELVLRGFAAADRAYIAKALQTELTNLFTQDSARRGMPSCCNIERIRGGSFKVVGGAKPATIGAQLAHSVYRQVALAVLGPRARRTRGK